jgi:hypothetical protein
MANTTNYNWETPDDTDLVKDGAAAIRTLGNSVDTTTKALNPETTLGDIAYRSATSNTNTRLPIGTAGQILAVSGGVPAWINNDQGDITEVQAGTGISVASGTGPIPVITNTVATAFDAAGDLVYGTGADTFTKLSLGTAGKVLTVNSGATAPEWATPAGGGANWSLLNAGGTALTGAQTVTVSGISGKDKIMVIIDNASSATALSTIAVRLNTDTGTIYYRWGPSINNNSTYSAGMMDAHSQNQNYLRIGVMTDNAGSAVSGGVTFTGCNSSGVKQFTSVGGPNPSGSHSGQFNFLQGYVDLSATITSISVFSSSGNLDAGTVYVYTSA